MGEGAGEPRTCANCQASLHGEYCHACGQKDMDLRVAIWRLLGDLVAEMFEADGRLAHTLPLFLLQPGKLVRAFVDGQRQRFTSPVRLLVFALAMGFVLVSCGGQRSLDAVSDQLAEQPFEVVDGRVTIELDGGSTSTIRVKSPFLVERLERLEGMNQRQAAGVLLGSFLDAAPTVALLLVPLLALFLELCWPRYLVIEHLLLATLLHAQGLLVLGLAIAVGWGPLFLLSVLWLYGQLLFGAHQVYGQPLWKTVPKVELTLVAYHVALLGALGLVVGMAIQGLG